MATTTVPCAGVVVPATVRSVPRSLPSSPGAATVVVSPAVALMVSAFAVGRTVMLTLPVMVAPAPSSAV
ncbi:hypothetical protein DEJ15_05225 [Curtobacterium sp. MCJR17_043]|nr:hypothetical protein [Curtobacterium sp. MCJR17_043]WIB36528.1 hypothetical protein DEJ15_05225 [Curtobacterium sp. MCJR17_043]